MESSVPVLVDFVETFRDLAEETRVNDDSKAPHVKCRCVFIEFLEKHLWSDEGAVKGLVGELLSSSDLCSRLSLLH
jgi:hypothetical protein